VPSRVDAYKMAKQLFLGAGIVTVVRGYHFPDEASFPANSYPLAAWVEDSTTQLNPQGNYAFLTEWEAKAQLWLYSALLAPPGMGNAGWDEMDALHDAVLDSFARYFAGDGGPAPQTVVLSPVRFEPFYWYREERAPNVVGAEMTIKVNVNQAFQSGSG
jgi:hypothetical protein